MFMFRSRIRSAIAAPSSVPVLGGLHLNQSIRALATENKSDSQPTGEAQSEAKPKKRKVKSRAQRKLSLNQRKEMKDHLRRLVPTFQAIGTKRTEILKPSMMLEHTSSNITLETMMAAGMHMGHSASLWNPLNLPFIFGEREGVHIINLEHTTAALRRAAHVVKKVAYHGGIILFSGARKEHRQLAVDAALHADQYFFVGKWIPGTLTNPNPILGRELEYRKSVWDVEEARDFADYKAPSESQPVSAGKARYLKMVEEKKEQEVSMNGSQLKTYKPDLIITLNPLESRTMLVESRLAFVPTIGIVDTNCDPRRVTYPIPCNDDSLRGVTIVAGVLARAARDGFELRRQRLRDAVKAYSGAAIEKAANEATTQPQQ
ncbi:hypothetical protein GGI25_003981 [Coemansia spiralis]|uniref:Ribosomal protein S2 n=2 Tax=Coemansia TaxID=4863 RepID=A0A9W8G5P3_9FUNG|nr:ribosomal protein S2, flavodoxin-like domain-containing protein [Coemansia spiralis]KAJ1990757.1 hypothetical protein EDC05_003851 [Coemansia umbellata]KAJ2620899.1 hypothetical protein GGI26_004598 [Coemansia sp. RSA 1358]KAJ2675473.1 hypothetical protein GGI25_003981 [Coemansia spiralis]